MDRTESDLAKSSHPDGGLDEASQPDFRARAELLLDEDADGSENDDSDELSREQLRRELRLQRIENDLQKQELNRYRDRLEATRERYTDLYFHAPVGYVTLDADGVIGELNYLAAELLGGNRSNLVDTPLPELVHPDRRDALRDHLEALSDSTGVHHRELPVELPTDDVVYLKMLTIAVDNPDDGTTQYRAALFDITEKHRTERDKEHLEERLELSQRMETIGRLASGIAHDFNNLLTLIIGYSKLAINHLDDDHPLAKHVREINKAGRHAGELIEQLLAFSRSDGTASGPIDANALIEEMETMFDRLIGDDIELHIHLQESLGVINFDASQFKQVLMNLVVNAREAMVDGGELAIRTRNVQLTPDAAARLDLEEGPFAVVEVEDDGDGIPPEVIPHIFEPFFTTKDTGDNHGFGLSTTYGIVNRHGGAIDVVSEPDGGTTFYIYVPRVDETDSVDESSDLPAVLVVDDQPELRDFASLVLEEMEIELFSAPCPEEALQLSRNIGADLDLIVTDVTMPKMSGPQLLEKIRRIHSGVEVLYISGYDQASLHSEYGVEADEPILQKPFSPEALRTRVEEFLTD